MSQEGSFGQNRFEGQRPRGLDATRVKYTWFYMKSGIQRPDYVKPLSPIVSPGFIDILGTQILGFKELKSKQCYVLEAFKKLKIFIFVKIKKLKIKKIS